MNEKARSPENENLNSVNDIVEVPISQTENEKFYLNNIF